MIKKWLHGVQTWYKELTKLQKICCWILGFQMFAVLFAPVIANDKPLFCICDGQWQIPAITARKDLTSIDFHSGQCTFKLWAPVPWTSGSIDPKSSGYVGPWHLSGPHRHILGTDGLGRDVFAGMIYGTRYAWIVGLLATLFAAIPGVLIGMMIGYWKNNRLLWSWGQWILTLLWMIFCIYELNTLGWIIPRGSGVIVYPVAILSFYFIGRYLWRLAGRWGKKAYLPLESFVMRGIDIFESFPKLLLLMALMVVVNRPSMLALSILIATIRWTLFAQIARGATMKESVSNYVIAAENINIPWYQILLKHIWPNIKDSILITAVFSFSASVLLEASLSFIGLGLRLEQVTWGGLMNEGRNYFPGWWLSVFPGIAIFSLLFSLNWLFIIKSNPDNATGGNPG